LPVPAFYPVQAAGNILLACLLLFVGLGCKLRAAAYSGRVASAQQRG